MAQHTLRCAILILRTVGLRHRGAICQQQNVKPATGGTSSTKALIAHHVRFVRRKTNLRVAFSPASAPLPAARWNTRVSPHLQCLRNTASARFWRFTVLAPKQFRHSARPWMTLDWPLPSQRKPITVQAPAALDQRLNLALWPMPERGSFRHERPCLSPFLRISLHSEPQVVG